MSNIIKVGSFDVTSIKIGSSDVDKVMVGDVQVYPQETPVTSYKWRATYVGGSVTSAECDSTSAITENEIAKTNLVSVEIGNCVTSIGASAFTDCNTLASVTIPNGVTSIGQHAFKNCTSLTSVTIPNSVTSISNKTFYNCTSLTSVTIPSSVTSIEAEAFEGCNSLSSITIPNSVTSIGGYAFIYCSKLTSITVNATTPPTLGSNVFDNTNNCPIYVPCISVDAYKAAAIWKTYATRIACIQPTTAITYLASSQLNVNLNGFTPAATAHTFANGIGKVEFAAPVTAIGIGFYGQQRLTYVIIPNSVTSIGTNAFNDCQSLSSITIPSSVTTIGDDAFEYCDGLTDIKIPNSVTTIGDYAFNQCSAIGEVTIGNGVTSIGEGAFLGCTNLFEISIAATTPPTLGILAFDSTNDCPIVVPCESLNAYKTAWSTYSTRIECNDYKTKYFTIVLEDNGTIRYSASTTANTVQYSTDNGRTWTSLPSKASTPTISGGKKVRFKATGLVVNTTSGIGKLSATTSYSVEGNIMSLVSGDSFANADVIPNANQFRRLFYNYGGVTNAENLVLPATVLTNGCYFQMFAGCSNLIAGPRKMEIPSTMPQSGCTNMFSGCSSMTECLMDVGSLSSSTIGANCYYNMFRLCKSLTALTSNQNQIVLPAATLTNQCYYGMFVGCSGLTQSVYIGCSSIPSGGSGLTQMMSGCTNITEIYCAATGVSSSNLCNGTYSPTYMWVSNVGSSATSGNFTFHAHVGEQWSNDVTCMSQYCASYPNGWTYVADITT